MRCAEGEQIPPAKLGPSRAAGEGVFGSCILGLGLGLGLVLGVGFGLVFSVFHPPTMS